jgi:hypothetical protein
LRRICCCSGGPCVTVLARRALAPGVTKKLNKQAKTPRPGNILESSPRDVTRLEEFPNTQLKLGFCLLRWHGHLQTSLGQRPHERILHILL